VTGRAGSIDGAFPIALAAKIGGGIVGAFIALNFILGGFASVDVGHVGVIESFGNLGDVRQPGLGFKNPFTEKLVQIDVRTQRSGEIKAEAASKDLQTVDAVIVVNYHYDAGAIKRIMQTVQGDPTNTLLAPALQDAFKATTAQFTAVDLIQQREAVKSKAKDQLRAALPSFIVVDELNIVNFDFSKAFNAAIDAAQTQKQRNVEAEGKLAQIKIEAGQQVAQAEAAALATRARADAEAYATRVNATATADAQRAQAAALTPLYVEYIKAQKWQGQVPATVLGDSSAFLINLK
jgi:regulator of protease activity HflC (stomatin/prohibitin superfamily)